MDIEAFGFFMNHNAVDILTLFSILPVLSNLKITLPNVKSMDTDRTSVS